MNKSCWEDDSEFFIVSSYRRWVSQESPWPWDGLVFSLVLKDPTHSVYLFFFSCLTRYGEAFMGQSQISIQIDQINLGSQKPKSTV